MTRPSSQRPNKHFPFCQAQVRWRSGAGSRSCEGQEGQRQVWVMWTQRFKHILKDFGWNILVYSKLYSSSISFFQLDLQILNLSSLWELFEVLVRYWRRPKKTHMKNLKGVCWWNKYYSKLTMNNLILLFEQIGLWTRVYFKK